MLGYESPACACGGGVLPPSALGGGARPATMAARTNVWRKATSPARGEMLGVSTALRRPLAARVEWKPNMTWQNPDLYLFLGLLAGCAAFLAIIYEFIQKSRRRKPPVFEPRRSTVTEKAVAPPSPPKHAAAPSPPKAVDPPSPPKHSPPPKPAAAPSPFDQLCESIKDLPPKEQARRMDQHFGVFGGARPTKPPFGPPPGRWGRN
jgi:hypothetical protein